MKLRFQIAKTLAVSTTFLSLGLVVAAVVVVDHLSKEAVIGQQRLAATAQERAITFPYPLCLDSSDNPIKTYSGIGVFVEPGFSEFTVSSGHPAVATAIFHKRNTLFFAGDKAGLATLHFEPFDHPAQSCLTQVLPAHLFLGNQQASDHLLCRDRNGTPLKLGPGELRVINTSIPHSYFLQFGAARVTPLSATQVAVFGKFSGLGTIALLDGSSASTLLCVIPVIPHRTMHIFRRSWEVEYHGLAEPINEATFGRMAPITIKKVVLCKITKLSNQETPDNCN